MYLRGLASLALDPWSAISSALSIGKAAGLVGTPQAPESAGGGASISTAVQTTVSPQISPVFVQQDSPTNSPVNAGTVQTSPSPMTADFGPQGRGTPQTGYMPGFDYGSGYVPTGTSVIPSQPKAAGLDMGTIALAAAGLLGLAFVVKKKPGAARRKARRK